MNRKTLLDILATPSPSGWEKAGQSKWMDMVGKVADRVKTDAYGNAWAELDGSSKSASRVMLEAHSDEIGFIVRHVDEKGFLSIGPIGGSDKTLVAARRITIFGSKGLVPGIIGNTAIHLRDTAKDKVPDWKDHFVDVGARSAAEVAKLGIRVGNPAIFDSASTEFHGDNIVGRALDNRIGGFILALTLGRLRSLKKRPRATALAANCVQEEIGSHGAKMAAHRLAPSIAIIFDVTHATDTPGIPAKEHGLVELGKGPAVAHGAANHPLVVERLIEVAEKEKIPLQHEAISRSTRTDADVIYTSLDGIPCALISIPLRYMHSPVEMVSMKDVESAARLAAAFIASLSDKDTFRVHG
ncbi:MAG: M20/M25/M40 family metallo-hydrolase [Verrucomicrobia bacterium]|nr:M20/M25/M40 family metallo-hydrolase [Verrucomicrobiota bacterium]